MQTGNLDLKQVTELIDKKYEKKLLASSHFNYLINRLAALLYFITATCVVSLGFIWQGLMALSVASIRNPRIGGVVISILVILDTIILVLAIYIAKYLSDIKHKAFAALFLLFSMLPLAAAALAGFSFSQYIPFLFATLSLPQPVFLVNCAILWFDVAEWKKEASSRSELIVKEKQREITFFLETGTITKSKQN